MIEELLKRDPLSNAVLAVALLAGTIYLLVKQVRGGKARKERIDLELQRFVDTRVEHKLSNITMIWKRELEKEVQKGVDQIEAKIIPHMREDEIKISSINEKLSALKDERKLIMEGYERRLVLLENGLMSQDARLDVISAGVARIEGYMRKGSA